MGNTQGSRYCLPQTQCGLHTCLGSGWASPAPWSVWGRLDLLHDSSEAASLFMRFLCQLPLTAHSTSDFCPIF